jgi:hypothetical protein
MHRAWAVMGVAAILLAPVALLAACSSAPNPKRIAARFTGPCTPLVALATWRSPDSQHILYTSGLNAARPRSTMTASGQAPCALGRMSDYLGNGRPTGPASSLPRAATAMPGHVMNADPVPGPAVPPDG